MTESLTEADIVQGAYIETITDGGRLADDTKKAGIVKEIVEETKHTGINSTIEQTLVVLTDGEDEHRINIDNLTSEGGQVEVVDYRAPSDDEDDSDDEDGKPEVAADGGEDVTEHVTDAQIEAAIKNNDDPDHPDALTVEEVRDALAAIDRSTHAVWGEWMDNIEDGEATVVAETSNLLVLDTGDWNMVHEELKHHRDLDGDDEVLGYVLTEIMHKIAREHCDRNWGVTYPLVLRKPAGFDAGQQYVETVINGLQARGLTPGQAWAYYGVEIRGNSRRSWGIRKGDHDHKNVSDALEKANEKLGA